MPVFDPPTPIHAAVPREGGTTRRDLVLHRRRTLEQSQISRRQGIPVTKPVATLVDVAAVLDRARLERAINEADKRSLVDPERLRAALEDFPKRPGLAALKRALDSPTFALTDSELERRFLRLVRRAGLPMPRTQTRVNGYRVDFFWPGLGLVVETDGLTYHRTPAQQARDRLRDQGHTAAGMTPLRFPHAQIRDEPEQVLAILVRVVELVRRHRAA
jgi:very-short-patch-repair endonuclease